ncbi:MAG TPA: DUF975 family protein [Clostridia bacterium]|nr:DUF975 family protein [Clostridia bacterium]
MESTGWDAPRAEFRARDFRRIARDKLKGNWGLALGTSLLFMLCCWAVELIATGISPLFGMGASLSSIPFWNGDFSFDFDSLMQYSYIAAPAVGVYSLLAIALSLAATAVISVLTLGHNKFYVDLCNNKAELSTLFSRFQIFFKAFGLMLFMGLFIFLWALLLYIPGIVAAYRYSMAPYLMAQHPEMGIREAVNESKRLMAGHKGRLFCLQLSFIGWILLCVLTLGIGYLWLVPYMEASSAAFYLDRSGQGIPLNAKPEPAVALPDNGSNA